MKLLSIVVHFASLGRQVDSAFSEGPLPSPRGVASLRDPGAAFSFSRSQDGAVWGGFNDQRVSASIFSAGDYAPMLWMRRRLQNHAQQYSRLMWPIGDYAGIFGGISSQAAHRGCGFTCLV